MKKAVRTAAALIAAAIITLTSSCTITVPHSIISAGPSTYIASSGGGIYTFDSGAVRESVYKAANDFCASKGLVMVPIEETERPYQLAHNTASITLSFKALTKEEAAKWNIPVKHTVLN
jgi:hypothetical protein